jgi:hypothetical protein
MDNEIKNYRWIAFIKGSVDDLPIMPIEKFDEKQWRENIEELAKKNDCESIEWTTKN